MSTKRSERQRWVTVFVLGKALHLTDGVRDSRHAHERAHSVIAAFEKVGRVVRAEVEHDAIVFKARRS